VYPDSWCDEGTRHWIAGPRLKDLEGNNTFNSEEEAAAIYNMHRQRGTLNDSTGGVGEYE